MSLTIEVGKFYKTKSGNKAVVYAIYPEQRCSILGAVFERRKHGDSCSSWNPQEWLSDGRYSLYADYAADLIAPWSDPPAVDWDKFPSYIVAVAQNFVGEQVAFLTIPTRDDMAGFWRCGDDDDYEHQFIILPGDRFSFSGDWRDSLAIRPGHEEGKQ